MTTHITSAAAHTIALAMAGTGAVLIASATLPQARSRVKALKTLAPRIRPWCAGRLGTSPSPFWGSVPSNHHGSSIMAKNSPEKVYRVGHVSASIFVNTSTREDDAGESVEREFRSTSLQRSYRDEKGNWQYSGNLTLGDLANAIRALTLAQGYVEEKEATVVG